MFPETFIVLFIVLISLFIAYLAFVCSFFLLFLLYVLCHLILLLNQFIIINILKGSILQLPVGVSEHQHLFTIDAGNIIFNLSKIVPLFPSTVQFIISHNPFTCRLLLNKYLLLFIDIVKSTDNTCLGGKTLFTHKYYFIISEFTELVLDFLEDFVFPLFVLFVIVIRSARELFDGINR